MHGVLPTWNDNLCGLCGCAAGPPARRFAGSPHGPAHQLTVGLPNGRPAAPPSPPMGAGWPNGCVGCAGTALWAGGTARRARRPPGPRVMHEGTALGYTSTQGSGRIKQRQCQQSQRRALGTNNQGAVLAAAPAARTVVACCWQFADLKAGAGTNG